MRWIIERLHAELESWKWKRREIACVNILYICTVFHLASAVRSLLYFEIKKFFHQLFPRSPHRLFALLAARCADIKHTVRMLMSREQRRYAMLNCSSRLAFDSSWSGGLAEAETLRIFSFFICPNIVSTEHTQHQLQSENFSLLLSSFLSFDVKQRALRKKSSSEFSTRKKTLSNPLQLFMFVLWTLGKVSRSVETSLDELRHSLYFCCVSLNCVWSDHGRRWLQLQISTGTESVESVFRLRIYHRKVFLYFNMMLMMENFVLVQLDCLNVPCRRLVMSLFDIWCCQDPTKEQWGWQWCNDEISAIKIHKSSLSAELYFCLN